jgi:hypothetical protein
LEVAAELVQPSTVAQPALVNVAAGVQAKQLADPKPPGDKLNVPWAQAAHVARPLLASPSES